VLRRITARLRTLPLVSTRWARIMQTSADVWQQACLDLPEIVAHVPNQQRPRLSLAAMAAWLLARPGRFVQLGLRRTHGDVRMPPSITGMLLSTQAASLQSLSIDPSAYSLQAFELETVAALHGLTALHVRLAGNGLADRGAAVLWAAARLPALTQLDIVYVPAAGELLAADQVGLPCCRQLSELHSQSLTHLCSDLVSGADSVLSLSGLPNLIICQLFWQAGSASIGIDSTSFHGCTRLEELTVFDQRGLSLQPECFHATCALTSLTLRDCGLLAVPTALAPLVSLRSLDISRNDDLQVDEAGASLLRALKKLRTLDVAKYEPAVHSMAAVQALFHLVEAFRHEGLHLNVIVNLDLSAFYPADPTFWGFIE